MPHSDLLLEHYAVQATAFCVVCTLQEGQHQGVSLGNNQTCFSVLVLTSLLGADAVGDCS